MLKKILVTADFERGYMANQSGEVAGQRCYVRTKNKNKDEH